MNPRDRLDEYLSELRDRLRLAIFTRAGAAVAVAVLLGLSLAVYLLNLRGFPAGGVVVSRIALFIAVAVLVGVLLWWPLRVLARKAGAAQFEEQLPEQRGRIQTYLEQKERGQASPLVDLLAEDAFKLAQKSPVETIVSPRRIWIAGAVAAGAVLVLLVMLTVAKSEWGYGTRYVLLGVDIPRDAVPVRQVDIKPGNKTLRRNSDLSVQADVKGFKPEKVELFVKFSDTDRWEQASMQLAPEKQTGKQTEKPGEQYAFTLYALRAPLSYYVRADGVQSAEHSINVVDVPRIEKMELAFKYPDWTNLQPQVETEIRDINAVADTQVKVSLVASAPLEDAAIVIDKDSSAMQANSATTTRANGSLVVEKPARYHIASRVAGEMVALTDEYEISIVDDQAPTIEIVRPGRDARASSIEEVPVAVQAKDDFKVQNVELRYAVNGGDWKHVKLPAQSSDVQAKTLLQLEELGGKQPLVPGDLITYYAVSGDRKQTAQTDLFMVQVQPFERRFTEGQGGGGGGGGEGDSEQQQIAERQRDLLVATWNLERAREQKRRTPEQLKESAQMLSNLQDKLAEQTATLVERTRARVSVESDPRVKSFIESLESAVKAMAPASTNLKELELKKAIPSEQTALQMLQRAEASFRDIQVARSQDSQGGGAASASRDISELYELEMDLSKNKYETEKELSQETKEQTVDEAVEKLKELARRQQQLAEQRQQQPQQQTNAERWKQEQLRREAEELRKRLQELANQQMAQQQGQQSGQQGQQGQQGQSGQSGQSGQAGNSQQNEAQQTQAALRNVENALQAMKNAENARDKKSAEEASRSLQQAAERMQRGNERPSPSNAIDQLADQAAKIAEAQRKSEVDLKTALSNAPMPNENQLRMRRDGLNQAQARKLAEQKSQMLAELQQLEDKLRNASQSQRRAAPQTSQRLGEIVDDLSSVNLSSRISQTIVDLERGRADQSSMNEALITQTLQDAASDLRNAARMAGQEAERKAQTAEPEAMLSEVAQLRRALEIAKQAANQAGANQGAANQNAQNRNGQQGGEGTPSGKEGQQGQQGQEGQSPGQQGSEGNSQNASNSQQGGQQGQQGQRGGTQAGGGNGQYANGGPIGSAQSGNWDRQRVGDGADWRLGNAIRQQLNAIQERVAAGNLTLADLQALRQIAPQIRRISGDALAAQLDLIKSVERLELAALAAAEKSKAQVAARSGAAAQGSSNDAEAVAEYYRRLGK